MYRNIKDKVFIITGGAEGLGYSIADNFLQHEAKLVIILDMNEDKGMEACNTLNAKYGNDKVVFIKCDVTKDLEEVSSKIIKDYETIDVLVNSAGILNETNIRKTMETNVIALMEWSAKFREHMRTDKGGRGGTILNIASKAGYLVDPFIIYYKCSKFAVIAYTKSMGHEYNYNNTGVRIIALCPGLTDTALGNRQMCWDEHLEGFNKMFKNLKLQSPDAVGNAAVQVIENADSGTAWVISGGKPIYEAPDIVKLSMNSFENLF